MDNLKTKTYEIDFQDDFDLEMKEYLDNFAIPGEEHIPDCLREGYDRAFGKMILNNAEKANDVSDNIYQKKTINNMLYDFEEVIKYYNDVSYEFFKAKTEYREPNYPNNDFFEPIIDRFLNLFVDNLTENKFEKLLESDPYKDVKSSHWNKMPRLVKILEDLMKNPETNWSHYNRELKIDNRKEKAQKLKKLFNDSFNGYSDVLRRNSQRRDLVKNFREVYRSL